MTFILCVEIRYFVKRECTYQKQKKKQVKNHKNIQYQIFVHKGLESNVRFYYLFIYFLLSILAGVEGRRKK